MTNRSSSHVGDHRTQLRSPLSQPLGGWQAHLSFTVPRKVGQVFEQVRKVRTVLAESVDRGRYDLEAVCGNVMGCFVGVCSGVQVSVDIALGEWFSNSEVGKEP